MQCWDSLIKKVTQLVNDELGIKLDIVFSFCRDVSVSLSLCNLPDCPELLSVGDKIKSQMCQTLKSILSTLSF